MRILVVLPALAFGGAGTALLVSRSAAGERNVTGAAESATSSYDCGPVDFDHYDAGAQVEDYNHHRRHSAIGRQPPITRLNNLLGSYT